MALTYEQGVQASQAFLSKSACYPGYRYVLSEGSAVTEGWIFRWQFARLDGQPLAAERDHEVLRNQGYYIVSATDGSIRGVTWKEMFDRKIIPPRRKQGRD